VSVRNTASVLAGTTAAARPVIVILDPLFKRLLEYLLTGQACQVIK
jgi:hypothetical protein